MRNIKYLFVICVLAIFLSLPQYYLDKIRTYSQELIPADLVEVIDGDTIKVELDGELLKVRLIGVDAPESVHADATKNNEFGKMASEFTADFFEKYTTVYLQYDKDRQDQYGRELCYVWLEDDVDVNNKDDISSYMFNSILIASGYASDVAYEPNTSYADYFKSLSAKASAGKKGLWQYENFEKTVSQ